MPEKIIDITAIHHTFSDGYRALKDLSLSIYRGEFILLAGRNGSGKSTLLRHLNGLLLPDSGQITVNGRNVSTHLIQTRKTVGMVFQDPDTQIVGDTVFDEAAFGLENLKVNRSRINETVTRVLADLNLIHLKDRHPASLSGGEKRKLAIAGILVMNPQVILFDEPFSNLDYPGTLQVLSTIISLNRSGHTILMATHDVEPVICEATRILIMENGELKKDGRPNDMVKHLETFGVREPCASKFGMGLQPWQT